MVRILFLVNSTCNCIWHCMAVYCHLSLSKESNRNFSH
uniref:Uncharacterized protein n=1 Tax=Anguilla anguilla TaxID=7936 RepID=A0A0E9PG25_ANGAN